jgi:hypothetical protein
MAAGQNGNLQMQGEFERRQGMNTQPWQQNQMPMHGQDGNSYFNPAFYQQN